MVISYTSPATKVEEENVDIWESEAAGRSLASRRPNQGGASSRNFGCERLGWVE